MRSLLIVVPAVFLLLLARSQAASFDAFDEEEDYQRWEAFGIPSFLVHIDRFSRAQDQNVASVPLEHCISLNGEFRVRGKMTYSGPNAASSRSRKTVSVQIEQSKLSNQDLNDLQALVDAGELYRVRVPSNVNDPSSTKVMASIPACLLVAAQFHEIFRVHVDRYGNIRGLWYQTAATKCPKGGVKVPTSGPVQLISSVSVDMDSKGPKLALEPVIKVEKEAQEKVQEEPPFWRKYWLYIAGGMLLMMMLNGEEEKKPGERGAAGGRPGGAAQRPK